jgi:hypothetical protein
LKEEEEEEEEDDDDDDNDDDEIKLQNLIFSEKENIVSR